MSRVTRVKLVFPMKCIILLFLLFNVSCVHALSYTKAFSEIELQNKLNVMMPITKKKFFITVVISNPKLELIESSNELGVQVDIQTTIPGGLNGNGQAHITGSISYNSDEGAFYLKKPTIVDIKIARMKLEYTLQIKALAQKTIAKVLLTQPVYKFKGDDLKHQLAKSTLESVTVKNKKLLVTLTFF